MASSGRGGGEAVTAADLGFTRAAPPGSDAGDLFIAVVSMLLFQLDLELAVKTYSGDHVDIPNVIPSFCG
jgi:hypothetical protein